MKKKNILLFILFAVASLLISNKVSASTTNTPLLGYIECAYKIKKFYYGGNWHEKVSSDNRPDFIDRHQIITFAYSELSFSSNKDYSNLLYVYHHDYDDGFVECEEYGDCDDYDDVQGQSGWNQTLDEIILITPGVFGFYSNTLHLEEMSKTFNTIFSQTVDKSSFSCPNYLILKRTDISPLTYIPKFTNELPVTSNEYEYIVFGELYSTPKKEILYGDEKGWDIDLNGSCTGLGTAKIFPDVTNKSFKITIARDEKNVLICPLAVNGEECGDLNEEIKIEDDNGHYTMDYIYNLLVENKIDKISIDGRQYKDSVILNTSKRELCNLSHVVLKPSYSCLTYEEINKSLIEKKERFDSTISDIQEIAQKILVYDETSQTYSGFNYANFDSLEDLSWRVDYLSSYNLADMGQNLSDYTSYLLSSVENMCTDPENREILEEEKIAADQTAAEAEKLLELLANELSAISNRLSELGDQEGAETANKFAEELGVMQEFLKQYSEKSKTMSFIKGKVNLKYEAGCGMITSGLKQWLIRALDIMKICALVLSLILGMFDFFRGVASGDAATMKKVWTNFSRRLIVVAILFLLPVILEFVLGVITIDGVTSSNPLCGIK